jgi:hypothetical protein
MTTSTQYTDATLPVSTSELTEAVQIRSSTQEQGQIAPKTVMEHFNTTVEQHGNSPALHYKMNKVKCSLRIGGMNLEKSE